MSALPAPDHQPFVTVYGLALQVRPLGARDREPLLEFFARLSDTSRFRRFMTGTPVLTGAAVRQLTDVDHHTHEVLVAIDETDGSVVGEARYAQWPTEPGSADVAFAVADAWQRQGIGTMLAAAIVERARRAGFRRLTASTFGDNAGARSVLRRVGFRTCSIGYGVADLALDLT